VLLYLTAEDVFGSDTPRGRGPRPLHTIPATLAGLYDLGLRHHLRSAAMAWWTPQGLERVPDWRFDRLAIRFAVFGRERLGLTPGERILVLGRLGWLWPTLDFAAMGFGVLPIGVEHDLGDDAVAGIAGETAARAAFATDPGSAERLLGLRRAGRLGRATVVGEGFVEGDGVLALREVVERAAVLDTAERAQAFRAFSRQVTPEGEALWHVGAHGVVRLTHAAAMARVAPMLRSRPAARGDVAYLDAPRVTLGKRLALAAFVGDGHTTSALGGEGHPAEELAELRPHKALVSEAWLEAVCSGDGGPRRPAWLDRWRARRRLQQALGGRLRWVEAQVGVSPAGARALAGAGVAVEEVAGRGEEEPWRC